VFFITTSIVHICYISVFSCSLWLRSWRAG